MSTDAIEVPVEVEEASQARDGKSVAALPEAAAAGTELVAEVASTQAVQPAEENKLEGEEGAGAGLAVESLAAQPGSDAKSSLEKRKESMRARRVSMFDEKPTKLQDGTPTGDLKDTLNEFFSTGPKDTTETSTALKPLRRPKLIYENTYRMDSNHPFISSKVQKCIQTILDDMLMDFKYNSKTSAHKAMEVAEKMRRNVLAFRFERFKICVLVTIAPLNRQGFFSGFRCLWSSSKDSYAVATMRNPSIFAIATCYGIYYE